MIIIQPTGLMTPLGKMLALETWWPVWGSPVNGVSLGHLPRNEIIWMSIIHRMNAYSILKVNFKENIRRKISDCEFYQAQFEIPVLQYDLPLWALVFPSLRKGHEYLLSTLFKSEKDAMYVRISTWCTASTQLITFIRIVIIFFISTFHMPLPFQ